MLRLKARIAQGTERNLAEVEAPGSIPGAGAHFEYRIGGAGEWWPELFTFEAGALSDLKYLRREFHYGSRAWVERRLVGEWERCVEGS